jgi:FlaA1/EpsC-like NDP-sugar epimerase
MSILMLVHAAIFTGAFLASWYLRFEFAVPERYWNLMWLHLPVFVGVQLAVFGAFRMFEGWWKYVSLRDVVEFVKALGIAVAACVLIDVFAVQTTWSVPRSIYILDFLLAMVALGGARGSLRLMREAIQNTFDGDSEERRNLLILGAGDTGETLLREITKNQNLPFNPVGFLDDDPYKHGLRMHGVPVLGPIDELDEVVEERDIDDVIVAMPSASREKLREVVERARDADVKAKTLPSVESILEGEVSLGQLRELSISDLLRREPVELDTDSIEEFVEGRTVMVTGAGGSIGSELCRQVARFDPEEIVMVERAETPLFMTERDLEESDALEVEPRIADVTETDEMAEIFRETHPDVVIHAAAYKHVPLMEQHPDRAVVNNVEGTEVTARLAADHGVDSFVLVSTDKAVNPTSIMGATKRVAEILVHELDAEHDDTNFCSVRFGNVLGSNGSVVPIFREQIENGGPVTVTHPEMRRYFMTIPEASQLVLQAAAIGEGGELFILDMGQPVKIVDLARDMIRLSGFSEDQIEIEMTGRRPGEKLCEELTLESEDVDKTRHEKIYVGPAAEQPFEEIADEYEGLLQSARRRASLKVRRYLKEILPDYEAEEIPENVVKLDSSGPYDPVESGNPSKVKSKE